MTSKKQKLIIKIFAIGMAVIFIAGVLVGAIGYIGSMNLNQNTSKQTTDKPSNLTDLTDKSTQDPTEIQKAIDLYLKNIAENPQSVMDIAGVAQRYTYLGQALAKEGKVEESKAAFQSAITYYESLIAIKPDYKVAAQYSIVDLKGQLGLIDEGEAILKELLVSEEGTNPATIYLAYGTFLKKYAKDNERAQSFFDKALASAKTDEEKNQINSRIQSIGE